MITMTDPGGRYVNADPCEIMNMNIISWERCLASHGSMKSFIIYIFVAKTLSNLVKDGEKSISLHCYPGLSSIS